MRLVVSSLVLLTMCAFVLLLEVCAFVLLLVVGSTELLILAVATVADLAALEADQALLLVLAHLLDRREPPPNGRWWVPVVVVLGAKDTTLLVVAATAATRMVLLTVTSVTPLVASSLVLLAVAAWRGFEVLRFEPVVESGDARSELGATPRTDPPPQSLGTTTERLVVSSLAVMETRAVGTLAVARGEETDGGGVVSGTLAPSSANDWR